MLKVFPNRSQQRYRWLPIQPLILASIAAALCAGPYLCTPVPVGAQAELPAKIVTHDSECSPAQAAEVVASDQLRIERLPGRFAQPKDAASGVRTDDEQYRCCRPKTQAPVFAQALDGFSARWIRHLGTPVACPVVLCNGSCAQSETACELSGSQLSPSACCADMPVCEHP